MDKDVSTQLDIPLSAEKTTGPQEEIGFLGFNLDSVLHSAFRPNVMDANGAATLHWKSM